VQFALRDGSEPAMDPLALSQKRSLRGEPVG
jgi:hypothetical protein